MTSYVQQVRGLMRDPSAFVPLIMSSLAAALLAGFLAYSLSRGVVPQREADEGAAAHLYQLLIAGQLPFLAWFAIKWLLRSPVAALGVIAIQLAAIGITFVPLWTLGL